MLNKINSYLLTCTTIFSLVIAGCVVNPSIEAQAEENTNANSAISQTINNSFCPAMEPRNWHAWIDRVGEEESRLNILGEVDLPTPGYKVKWQPGILDRRRPPAQRINLSLVPPEGAVMQVITPTKVNFTMPTSILKYRSVMIYCGDKLLAEIPDVTSQEKGNVPIKDNSFCPAMETRNWHAWIDRVGEEESRLNISGEMDLPTPGYKVEWQPGILDRRKPPAQRISLSLVPPEGMVMQVITPTKVNFTMPTSILEYRSVMIYCGDKLLAEIPDVTPQEKGDRDK